MYGSSLVFVDCALEITVLQIRDHLCRQADRQHKGPSRNGRGRLSPPETLAELFREEDVSLLRYFPKGHVKREYAVVPQRMMDDRGRFKRLVETSVKYALSIPR